MARRRCTGLPGAFGLDGLLVNISADNRMITGGEDALYIARRLIVCSSEDIGMSDPHALPLVSSRDKDQHVCPFLAYAQGHGNLSSVPNGRSSGMPYQSCGMLVTAFTYQKLKTSTASRTCPRRQSQQDHIRPTSAPRRSRRRPRFRLFRCKSGTPRRG